MNRENMLARLSCKNETWDVIVIGGGATGVGVAVEAASRGYNTLLLERYDFGKGTSSRSTKLIHGGVRYMQQGNLSLVKEALRERAILIKNAPHLVHNRDFVVPHYAWWEGIFYGIGLKLYDLLAGKDGLGASRHLSRAETASCLPTIETKGLQGGILYHDGQFDDARLLINLVQTAAEQGATVINYMPVTDLLHTQGKIIGVRALDTEKGTEYELKAKAVINATGVFTDGILKKDRSDTSPLIRASQGIHLVLDHSFLPGDTAMMIPRTRDGRILFAVPWRDRVIIGTTDTPVETISMEPLPLTEEIDFLLDHTAMYLTKDPTREDILSIFVGLRPLVNRGRNIRTSALSRDHFLHVSRSGLVTITGGKWTTYRKMAEETIDRAIRVAQFTPRPCVTRTLKIHGCPQTKSMTGPFEEYGEDAIAIQDLLNENPAWAQRFHPDLSITACEVIWAIRSEMAMTVEDVLDRRTGSLILNARASIEIVQEVAGLMAQEMLKDKEWIKIQIQKYTKLAAGYLTH